MKVRRLLPVTAGVAAVLVFGAGGAAVAFVTGGGRGIGAAVVTGPDDVHVVAGSVAGVYPGGPATTAEVVVTNDQQLPFLVSGLSPNPGELPADCPASAWELTVPESLPTVAAAASVVMPVGVALRANAPAECQGLQLALDLTVTGRLG